MLSCCRDDNVLASHQGRCAIPQTFGGVDVRLFLVWTLASCHRSRFKPCVRMMKEGEWCGGSHRLNDIRNACMASRSDILEVILLLGRTIPCPGGADARTGIVCVCLMTWRALDGKNHWRGTGGRQKKKNKMIVMQGQCEQLSP